MKTIKYRVWDKINKVMRPVARISFGDDGSALTVIVEPAPKTKTYEYFVDRESGELMQFTGLKDKNGKEIYEGDIVRHAMLPPYISKQPEKTFAVTWLDYGYTPWLYDKNELEIIGNIYENKKLLK